MRHSRASAPLLDDAPIRPASVDLDNDGNVDRYSEYEYDHTGIRVAQTELDDVNNDGDFENIGTDTSERTDYLVDHHNHTGYAQVLEEMLDPDGDGNDPGSEDPGPGVRA
jgi:hypothetical protein